MNGLSANGLSAAAEAPIPRHPDGVTHFPLSAFQRRMWYLCTAYPGTASPVVYLSYRLRGPLSVEAMTQAIRTVVGRHDGLRAVLEVRDGSPVQRFDQSPHRVEMVDLGGLEADEREVRLSELLQDRTQTLFDLVGEPLVRSCLIRLGDADHVLSVIMHHIVADGASTAIMVTELSACYTAFLDGATPDLTPLTIGYGDFALWQQSTTMERSRELPGVQSARERSRELPEMQSAGEQTSRGLAYWRDKLAGVAVLELPTDHPRPMIKGTRGDDIARMIGEDLTAGVDALARTARCSTFTVLLAAYQALLSRRSGQHDICVGIPVAGRTRVELEAMIGLFGNMVALRVDLTGDPTFSELLGRARAVVLGGLSRQDVPFGEVVAHLDLPRDPSRTQVFQTIAVLHTQGTGELELPGLTVEPIPAGMPQMIHDLVLDMWQRPGGLETVWRFDTALFRHATVEELAADFEELLRVVVADPGTRLSSLPGAAP